MLYIESWFCETNASCKVCAKDYWDQWGRTSPRLFQQGVVLRCINLVSQAIRIFPRAHARGKGGGGREGKILWPLDRS